MREIGAFEAENKLGQLLDWVEAGEEVVITRRGRAVARLVPSKTPLGIEQAQQAAETIRAMSKGTTLGETTLKSLIAEGRF